jgi:hypothetical protein
MTSSATGEARMESFEQIFAAIKAMFEKHAPKAVPKTDAPGAYYLDTHEVRAKDGYRTAFGGVEIKKTYVSVHLIPVYVEPHLLDGISPALKARMQGKSCFISRKWIGNCATSSSN